MTILEWVGILTVAVMLFGIVFAGWRHAETKRNELKSEVDGKISRNYVRLDECKVEVMDEMKGYTRKDICKVLHERVERDLKDIKAKVDIIPDIQAKLTILVNGKNHG